MRKSQLLTEATPVAPALPKPRHANLTGTNPPPSPPVPARQGEASPRRNAGGGGRRGARAAATRSRRREGAVTETPAPAGQRSRRLLWHRGVNGLRLGPALPPARREMQSLSKINAPRRRRHVYTRAKGPRQNGTGAITDKAPAVSSAA